MTGDASLMYYCDACTAELAGRALERAGVDPSSVIQEVQPHDDK